MDKETILDKIKNIVYVIVLPIYLWSCGYKTLEEYVNYLEKDYERCKLLKNNNK